MLLEIANQIIKLSFENITGNHKILENVAIHYSASPTSNHDFEIITNCRNDLEEGLKKLPNGPVRLNSNPASITTVLSSNKFISHISWSENLMTITIDTKCNKPDLFVLENVKLLIALLCIQKGGLPCHSSTLFKNDKAIAFVGNSGSGKSTIASMMSKTWNLIDDDFNLFLPEHGFFYVHTTPFYILKGTKEIPCKSRPIQLNKIFILKKSIITKMTPVSLKDKYIIIIGNTFAFPVNDYFGELILENCQRLCETVPIFNLFFSKSDDIALKMDDFLS
jgi:hypothetical protein